MCKYAKLLLFAHHQMCGYRQKNVRTCLSSAKGNDLGIFSAVYAGYGLLGTPENGLFHSR